MQDLHPHDRGPRGTHEGAIISNGCLYCPCTPRALLEIAPLARAATPQQATDHDAKTAELARYKLGRLTSDDAGGYHRVACPAATGKTRCPLRPASMTLDRDRPEILQPRRAPAGLLHPADDHRPGRGRRQDQAKARLPVGGLAALLRPAHRRRALLRHHQGPRHQRHQPRLVPPHGPSAPHAVHPVLLAVRNQRILAAWDARQEETARRAARGLPPRTRKRRRKTPAALTAAAPP